MTHKANKKINTLSILAIIFSIPFIGVGIVGVVLGIVALVQIKKTGERGKTLAWLAIIINVAIIIYAIAFIVGAKINGFAF